MALTKIQIAQKKYKKAKAAAIKANKKSSIAWSTFRGLGSAAKKTTKKAKKEAKQTTGSVKKRAKLVVKAFTEGLGRGNMGYYGSKDERSDTKNKLMKDTASKMREINKRLSHRGNYDLLGKTKATDRIMLNKLKKASKRLLE